MGRQLPRKTSELEEFFEHTPESLFWGMFPGAWYRAVKDRDEVAAFYIGVGLGATGGAMFGTYLARGAFAATDNFVSYAYMQKVRFMPIALIALFAGDMAYHLGENRMQDTAMMGVIDDLTMSTMSAVYPPTPDTRGGDPIFDFSNIWG